MQNKDTITPEYYYHIVQLKDGKYLFDGYLKLFKIKKIFNAFELLYEMINNECIKIYERFHTNDGKEYLYVVDIEDYDCDYLVEIKE